MQADSAQQQGLYRPEFDHDACGIGALAIASKMLV